MKKIIILLLISVFMFFSCTTETQGEKETIKEIITQSDNSDQEGYKLLNEKVYPVAVAKKFQFPSFGTPMYAGDGNGLVDMLKTEKDANFVSGIFCFDNSYNSIDVDYYHVWHTLDLSAQVGNQTSKVTMYIKVIAAEAGGIDESAVFKFKDPNVNFEPVQVSQKLNDEYYYSVQVTTDINGCILWGYFGNNAYDRKTDAGEPDYHDYEGLTCEIYVYEKWKSDVL
jgi:hypothetical protein